MKRILILFLLSLYALSCFGQTTTEHVSFPVIRYNPATYLWDVEGALADPDSYKCLRTDSEQLAGLDKEVITYLSEQGAYPYDTDLPAYATWLFRSGQQDGKPGSDEMTMLVDVKSDGDRCIYNALDMGWEFTSRIKVAVKDGNIIIDDMDIADERDKY